MFRIVPVVGLLTTTLHCSARVAVRRLPAQSDPVRYQILVMRRETHT